MRKILIVDDEEKLRALLARIVRLEGFEVLEAGDGKSGLKKIEENPDLQAVLCDVKLPDANGVELTKTIKTMLPQTEVILLTAFGNIPDGVQAMKNGAFDYLVKGDDNNKIIPLLYRAIEKSELSKQVLRLQSQLGDRHSFDNIIGQSNGLNEAIRLAQKVADTDTTVLLLGETGTGKEVFAQAIHHASKRDKMPFIALNCAAFGHDLLESELFGHKAGAFTGALRDKKGLLEEADGGTFFLDEIGEMPLDLQAKLLRALETGTFFKVGDSKPSKVNVRILAATNRDLAAEATEGRFRSDLYYRIAVFQITLPPLRERAADIEALARYFAGYFAEKTNQKILAVATGYFEALRQHHWPGNIRELKNVVERSVILMENGIVGPEHLPFRQTLRLSDSEQSARFDLASVEKKHIEHVLQHTNGNKTEAAKLLDIALTTLYRKMLAYGI